MGPLPDTSYTKLSAFYASVIRRSPHNCRKEGICSLAELKGLLCCNSSCNGSWGTGCWCCHSVKFALQASAKDIHAHLALFADTPELLELLLAHASRNCSRCGAEYRNVGHPLRPGVVMQRLCNCVFEIGSAQHEAALKLEEGSVWVGSEGYMSQNSKLLVVFRKGDDSAIATLMPEEDFRQRLEDGRYSDLKWLTLLPDCGSLSTLLTWLPSGSGIVLRMEILSPRQETKWVVDKPVPVPF